MDLKTKCFSSESNCFWTISFTNTPKLFIFIRQRIQLSTCKHVNKHSNTLIFAFLIFFLVSFKAFQKSWMISLSYWFSIPNNFIVKPKKCRMLGFSYYIEMIQNHSRNQNIRDERNMKKVNKNSNRGWKGKTLKWRNIQYSLRN